MNDDDDSVRLVPFFFIHNLFYIWYIPRWSQCFSIFYEKDGFYCSPKELPGKEFGGVAHGQGLKVGLNLFLRHCKYWNKWFDAQILLD